MKRKFREWRQQLLPPGYDASVEVGWLALGGVIAFIYSLCVFAGELGKQLRWLDRVEKQPVPWMMPYYEEILGTALWGFVILAILALLLIPVHGAYWYQGSRSIYLMRRLPQRGELLRRTAGLPLLLAAAALAAALLLLLLHYAIYCGCVPAERQPDGQWAELLRIWFGKERYF